MSGKATEPATCVGDLLLLFGDARTPVTARDAGADWTRDTAAGGWPLWTAPASRRWKGTPCLAASDGAVSVRLLGELYGLSGSDPVPLLLDVAEGRGRPERLNGHFALFAWDDTARELRVWTDRFGTLHTYYAQSGSRAAIGTFFPAVAAASSARRLDWAALTGFFGFGFFPDDRTFFDDVRILRPASHYVFDESGRLRSTERYATWDHAPDASRSYDDTVAEFACVFGEVMRDVLRDGRVAVPISGGLDSRSTVAEIRAPDARLWGFSYGYTADSIETRIARRIAASRSLRLDTYVIQPYLFDDLDVVLASVEGFQDVTQCRQAAVAAELAQHADYVVAAHWGDVWLDDTGLVAGAVPAPVDEAVVGHALHKIEKRGRAWLLDHLAHPHLGDQDPLALLRDFVSQAMDRLPTIADPDYRVKAFKTDNWSFRWTLSSVRMYQAAAFPRFPFYDTRMAEFFRTVPSAFVAGRRLQIDYLKRHAPDLARITWQARGANLYHCDRTGALDLPKRALRKLGRLVAGRQDVQRNWEVQFGGARGRAGLRHWLLRPGLRLHDLVPRSEVSALLNAFEQAPLEEGRGYTVSMLLSFSAWLERYG